MVASRRVLGVGLITCGAVSAFRGSVSPAARGAVWGVRRMSMHAPVVEDSDDAKVFSPKQERRRILQSPKFFRQQGFSKNKEAVDMNEFTSNLIDDVKTRTYTVTRGDMVIKLAKKFGFCWGVERAVAMAYEARQHFPDQNIHITNEIIHNPGVNERMLDMNMNFLPVEDGKKQFDKIDQGDVVILPAFGATIQEMQLLDKKGVTIVDTTCPWVSKVWTAVEKHRKLDATSVIHGKYSHEETVATASFAETYVIVKDLKEAEYVCNYILNGGDKEEFMAKFKNAVSKNFDPDKHLKKVGLANQTTMYKRETRAIGQMLEQTMMRKYGPDKVAEHYKEFDTICDATQERQDAIHELLEEKLDMVVILGGYDSSNTAHLKEIPHMQGVTSYHINRAECIRPDGSIEHREVDGSILVTENFLPDGPVTIGVTSGASTPDAYLEDTIERLFLLRQLKQA